MASILTAKMAREKIFTLAELAKYNGQNPQAPYHNQIYLSIAGVVFDVSSRPELYGRGGRYHMFAGREMSKNIGKSPLNPLSSRRKISSLEEEEEDGEDGSKQAKLTSKEQALLENMFCQIFKEKYPIVGKILDLLLKKKLFWIIRFTNSAQITKPTALLSEASTKDISIRI